MLKLGVAGLTPFIKTIGLFNSKAKNIIATCEALVTQHGGEVPTTREALEALPGVGRKTANVVLNTAFGESTMAVDTHIFRVADYLKDAHHWLILHGRYVCKARVPDCPTCLIADLCDYRHKTKPAAS